MKKYLVSIAAFSSLLAGCQTDQPPPTNQNIVKVEPTIQPTTEKKEANKNKDSHEHKAPHGGTLIAFGGEFAHLEIVLDDKTGKLTGYVLDGEAEKFVQISQPQIEIEAENPKKFTVILNAVENALTGEKIGTTSEFATTSEDLKGLKDFDGKVKSIKIKGKEFKSEKFNFPKGNEH
jgi:hypothetical protein